MALGGKGVISVLSNCMPRETHEIAALCLEDKFTQAREKALELLDFTNTLFCDVNPIPVKEALNLMGFRAGECRMPLVGLNEANHRKLEASMERLGLIGKIK